MSASKIGAVVSGVVLLGVTAAANAETVTLICRDSRDIGKPANAPLYYIDVDYDRNLVIISKLNQPTTPQKDRQGITAQPAQITDSRIVWRISTTRADGNDYSEHFRLNRFTGDLSYYDNGTQHGELWKCEPGQKPTKKF